MSRTVCIEVPTNYTPEIFDTERKPHVYHPEQDAPGELQVSRMATTKMEVVKGRKMEYVTVIRDDSTAFNDK